MRVALRPLLVNVQRRWALNESFKEITVEYEPFYLSYLILFCVQCLGLASWPALPLYFLYEVSGRVVLGQLLLVKVVAGALQKVLKKQVRL